MNDKTDVCDAGYCICLTRERFMMLEIIYA